MDELQAILAPAVRFDCDGLIRAAKVARRSPGRPEGFIFAAAWLSQGARQSPNGTRLIAGRARAAVAQCLVASLTCVAEGVARANPGLLSAMASEGGEVGGRPVRDLVARHPLQRAPPDVAARKVVRGALRSAATALAWERRGLFAWDVGGVARAALGAAYLWGLVVRKGAFRADEASRLRDAAIYLRREGRPGLAVELLDALRDAIWALDAGRRAEAAAVVSAVGARAAGSGEDALELASSMAQVAAGWTLDAARAREVMEAPLRRLSLNEAALPPAVSVRYRELLNL